MYLKNTSSTVCVMINTAVGKFGLQPGEVTDLKHKLLPPLSSHIKKITEEEYNTFRNPEQKPKEQTKEISEELANKLQQLDQALGEQSINTQEQTDTEQTTIISDVTTETIIDDVTEDIKDEQASDFIKKLFIFGNAQPEQKEEQKEELKFEEHGQAPTTDALKVEQTDSSNELTQMEAQLAKLKELWKQADTVRKKDKIHKQIKEVQKQIDKLNKDLNAGT